MYYLECDCTKAKVAGEVPVWEGLEKILKKLETVHQLTAAKKILGFSSMTSNTEY